MRPLCDLSASDVAPLKGVVFDLDDTLLDRGLLTEAAYSALFRLRDAGLTLVACTGRPEGWGDVILRQWPIDAVVAENGAIALAREAETPDRARAGRIVAVDALERSARRARRAELVALAAGVLRRFPSAALADDNDARLTDVTIDIGERCQVAPEQVRAMRAELRTSGARTLQSSVHLHLTFEAEDKATGVVRLLVARFGEDPTRIRGRYAFIGDSANDGPAFAAFTLTFGVSNVRDHAGHLSVPPRFIAPSAMGRGFAEIARAIVALRAEGGRGGGAEGGAEGKPAPC